MLGSVEWALELEKNQAGALKRARDFGGGVSAPHPTLAWQEAPCSGQPWWCPCPPGPRQSMLHSP